MVEGAAVRAYRRAVGDAVSLITTRQSARIEPIKGAAKSSLRVVHRPEPQSPLGINEAVVQTIVERGVFDQSQKLEAAGRGVEPVQARLQSRDPAGARRCDKARRRRRIPMLCRAGIGVKSVDVASLDVDEPQCTFSSSPHGPLAQLGRQRPDALQIVGHRQPASIQ